MQAKYPKVLFFDIETKPVKAWVWRTGEQRIRHDQIVAKERFDIICICYKWANSSQIYSLDWGIKAQNSAQMINKFVSVLESADVVVGQNSDSFDIKQVNTQRMLHKQPPISWPVAEDTRKQIKKHFYVTSSSLDYMSKLLLETGKDPMNFQDWIEIVDNKNSKALRKMIAYCKKDVKNLYDVWKRIAPYVQPKAHKGIICHDDKLACPSCASKETRKSSIYYGATGKRQKYHCRACGHIWAGKLISSC